MQVYKFGGASIATPERMKALLPIIEEAQKPLLVVVSALGKTTNALEEVVKTAAKGDLDGAKQMIDALEADHMNYAKQVLSEDGVKRLKEELDLFVTEMSWAVDSAIEQPFDYTYDQIVSVGELMSTTIFSHFLAEQSVKNKWVDARDIIRTNADYRDGKVDEDFTQKQMTQKVLPLFNQNEVIVSQGFIGCTDENATTTLGREGSDYSAALFASMLGAEKVSIWKDVEGLLNADPRLFEETIKIREISFYEVIEMSYYGAQVIHPKTIKPLQNKNIPLYVKCFLDRNLEGTVIKNEVDEAKYPYIIVLKKNQLLLQITTKDFSFVTEHTLRDLYDIFHKYHIKINLLQNAAISLVVCVDNNEAKIEALLPALMENYKVLKNTGVELLTVRHYTDEIINELTIDKEVLLSQKSRVTVQAVIKEK